MLYLLHISFSRAMGNKIMDPMPNLLLLMAVTPRQPLRQGPIHSSNSSMVPHMASKHQVSYYDGSIWHISLAFTQIWLMFDLISS